MKENKFSKLQSPLPVLNYLYKIEEEDIIISEKEFLKDDWITIYESEYLEIKSDFILFNNNICENICENINLLEKEIYERIKFSNLYLPSIFGICDHSTLGQGLVIEKPKGESIFTLVYNKEFTFNQKIELISNLISFFDFSCSRGLNFVGLTLNDFIVDPKSEKIILNKIPIISQNFNLQENNNTDSNLNSNLNSNSEEKFNLILDNFKIENLKNLSPDVFPNPKEIYNEKNSSWNLGLLIYEILEGQHLIFSEFEDQNKILEKLITESNITGNIMSKLNSLSYNQFIKNILKKLIKINQKQRTSPKLIKQYFNNNKKQIIESSYSIIEKEKEKNSTNNNILNNITSSVQKDFYNFNLNESSYPFNYNEGSMLENDEAGVLILERDDHNNTQNNIEKELKYTICRGNNNNETETEITIKDENIKNKENKEEEENNNNNNHKTIEHTQTEEDSENNIENLNKNNEINSQNSQNLNNEELMDRIFTGSNKKETEVNLIDEDKNNINDKEKNNFTSDNKVITPICGEINNEGENFLQFEEEEEKEEIKINTNINRNTYSNSNTQIKENIDIIQNNNIQNFPQIQNIPNEKELNESNYNLELSIIFSQSERTHINRLEELANDYSITNSEKCLEEIEEILLPSQNIKEALCKNEETITELLWETLLNLAYKYLESDDIKNHYTISSILYSTVEKVFPEKERTTKIALAKFHYGKSMKDFTCNYSLALNLFMESLKLLQNDKIEKIDKLEGSQKIILQINFFIGSLYDDMGKSEESIEMLKGVLEQQIQIYTEQHTFTARTYNCLGIAEDNRGNYRQAKEHYNKAYTIFKHLSYGLETIDCVKVLNNLAGIYFKWEDYLTCIKFYLKVLEVYLNKYGENCSYVAITYYNLGNCYLMLNNSEKALEALQKSNEIFKKELGLCHPQTAMCIKTIGDVYFSIEDNKNALEMYNQCINTFLEKYGDDNDMYISTLSKIRKLTLIK